MKLKIPPILKILLLIAFEAKKVIGGSIELTETPSQNAENNSLKNFPKPKRALYESTSGILEDILENYDKKLRPNNGGPPVPVNISMFILNIISVSETEMEFSTDLYFRQDWQDPRLSFEHKLKNNDSITSLLLEYEFSKYIWHPDTFFPNEKSSYLHTATINNEYVKILPDGSVLKSTRFTLTVACPMNLRYFPMDTQICIISIESYGRSAKDILYSWGSNDGNKAFGLAFNQDGLPQFRVVGSRTTRQLLLGNNFSRLGVEIQFVRSMGYYLMQIYAPCIMLVIVSWFSLWMDRESVTERMSLGVTTILTITMLLSAVNVTSPKIPYVKAIDVYLGICFSFVFASLLENSAVGYFVKREKNKFKNRIIQKLKNYDEGGSGFQLRNLTYGNRVLSAKYFHTFHGIGMLINGADGDCNWNVKEKKLNFGRTENEGSEGKKDTTECIDYWARICFPGAFLLFNLVYWIYYIKASKVETAAEFIFFNP